MTAAIHEILKESRDYYQALKLELIGKLLVNATGTLIAKSIRNIDYLYLRRISHKKRIDTYVGSKNSIITEIISNELLHRKKIILSLRSTKKALKDLHMDKNEKIEQDYTKSLRDLFEKFESEGLWDDGLQLIGSWCFKVFQSNFGVEFYPERTLDVDLAVKIPYSGRQVSIANILRSMGFEEQFDYHSNVHIYRCDDFVVEFLQDRQGNGQQRKRNDTTKNLGITTQALPYLKILLDNPTVLAARDIGKVCVPSMPAFVVHKLIVADARRNMAKKHKDYRQVESVCKTLCKLPSEISEVGRIANAIHKTWLGKMLRSFAEMARHIGHTPKATAHVLAAAGLIPSNPN